MTGSSKKYGSLTRNMIKQEPIMMKLDNGQLNWCDHITELTQKEQQRRCETGKGKKRERGRPGKTLVKKIKEVGTRRGKTK